MLTGPCLIRDSGDRTWSDTQVDLVLLLLPLSVILLDVGNATDATVAAKTRLVNGRYVSKLFSPTKY